ncbi:ABC transporter ATP-binding protein/permease [Amphibacillus cookii]|uniref:ABC transporter ATP-binding protein/permease n=1 Tax=Amphibacillus cookii TaxID=767787 RepID=UPI001957D7EC|nr:ABC transporter ATP-binding protein/permease [Amphibacillus cookii]MBM7542299.1 ABC-type lipoprotein export system ATPase subunit [Amphibacillus cookii]
MEKLKLVNINKSYQAETQYYHVLKKISLGFRDRELVTILGPSGTGKTTLVNIIGGLDQYDSGDLLVCGQSTKHFRHQAWDAYRHRMIGFVRQNEQLLMHQSVLENVELAMVLSRETRTERTKRAEQALVQVGLEKEIDLMPKHLTKVQVQQVAIARAIVNDPAIIVADEPTGVLDSDASNQIMALLRDLAETRLIIVATHDQVIAKNYSTRIISLIDGKVQSDSHPLTDQVESTCPEPLKSQIANKPSLSIFMAAVLASKHLLAQKWLTLILMVIGSLGVFSLALAFALFGLFTNVIEPNQAPNSLLILGFALLTFMMTMIMLGGKIYLSVIERRKEVVILYSIGARRRDISRLFIIETFIVAVVISLLGLVMTDSIIFQLNQIARPIIQYIEPLNLSAVAILGSVMIVVMLMIGIIPARKAARKAPALTLRMK